MEKKNIKVSEVVYDYLSSQGSTGESFDDVLRRLLGLNPTIEDLIAYLPDKMREYGKKVIDEILSIADDIQTKIETDMPYNTLIFHVRGLPIAKIDYGEESFRIYYRGQNGDMQALGGMTIYMDPEKEYEKLVKEIHHRIEGAYRRWARKTEVKNA